MAIAVALSRGKWQLDPSDSSLDGKHTLADSEQKCMLLHRSPPSAVTPPVQELEQQPPTHVSKRRSVLPHALVHH